MSIALLIVAALALAWANGANDNFKATATAYGSGALSHAQARALATAAQLSGSFASLLLADALIKAFGGEGLVPPEVVGDPRFLVSVAGGGALTVLAATRVGLPISTTHALVGGLAGAGWVLSRAGLSWAALGGDYFLPLLVSPLIATLAAAALYPLAHRLRISAGVTAQMCVCVGDEVHPIDVASDGMLLWRCNGLPLTIDERETCRSLYGGRTFGTSLQTLVDRMHIVSAFSLGFARGLNDTPKVLALLVAAGWSGIDPRVSLAIVAGAMAAGGWWRSRRVAETLAHGITSLSHGQGLIANGISSGLVIGASLLGSPVSTTHISTGALFGIGVWSERTDWRMVSRILLAWVGTLPLAAVFAAAIASVS